MNSFKQQLAKHRELAELAEAKFGKDLADSIRDELKDVNKEDRDLVDNGKVVWAKIDLKEETDKAAATLVGQNNPIRLVRINEKWYVQVPEWEGKPADKIKADVDRLTKTAAEKLTRADELIAKVRAGQVDQKQFTDALKDLKF
jgi:CHASE3 domain sensor protein